MKWYVSGCTTAVLGALFLGFVQKSIERSCVVSNSEQFVKLVGWVVVLFYSVTTLFGSFNAELRV